MKLQVELKLWVKHSFSPAIIILLPFETFIKDLIDMDLCQAIHKDAIFVLQNFASQRYLSF